MNDDEMIIRASLRMQDAADKAERAAEKMEQAAHRIALLLEDGYGGNGLILIELLEARKTP